MVLAAKAAVVAADHVPVTVRPAAHRVAAMFPETQRNQAFRRTIRFALSFAVVVAREPTVAAEVKIVAVKAEAHSAARRLGEHGRFVCPSDALRVVKNLDPPLT